MENFREKVIEFMESYINNGRTFDVNLLKELNDHCVKTHIFQTQKHLADFDDYSADDVFNHMSHKIIGAPFLWSYCATLCIPFIYEKVKAESQQKDKEAKDDSKRIER